MTETLTAPADYRTMGDDTLAVMLSEADGGAFDAIVAELDRRDRAQRRMARARSALGEIRASGESAAFAQYLQADAVCRGNLLSREGIAAGITDEMALWHMSGERAQRYASWELRDFWLYVQPRITSAGYVRQRAAQSRIARTEAMDGERDERDGNDGAGLAGPDAGPLRRDAAAEEAPQDGTGGPVQRGRHRAADEEAGPRGGTAGGAGGPVRGGAGTMSITDEIREAGGGGPPGSADVGEDGPEFTPGDRKHVLDETAEFVAKHVSCTQAQADVMTLYATASHCATAFPAFGRLLIAGETEACGKTVALQVTAALSANPLDASGTSYALQSALAAATNAPEQLTPTLYYDEISGVFGRSGLAATRDPLAEILRKGYKQGATRAWSVNRTAEQYSIYTPFIMAGLRNAVPRDIRTRCACVILRAGTPGAYFDTREAEPEARALSACLGQAVASRLAALEAFRARGIHPQLRDRHLEVWEPLFAVAWILGGQEWLNRCLGAFRELALAGSQEVTLTPRQQVLRDAVQVLDGPLAGMAATGFVGGLALADEMRRLDNPLYSARSEAGMARLISEAMPVPTTQKRVDGKPVRGYFACEITQAWDAVRPADPEDADIAEEANPFAVTDDTDDGSEVPALTGVTGVTEEMAVPS